MRNRLGTPMLIGGSLVALVAVATCVVAWLLWARAEERGRAEDDRAAQASVERLQNSVGRVLTSLRTAAGLVDADGDVDTASFHAWAQAVGTIGATDALALADVVPARERATFEKARGRRISELSQPGVFRGAARRSTYVPIVAVWPEPGTRGALLGFDLLSEPTRRSALEQAESTRRTAFTGRVPFLTGGSGFQAFRPVYAPTGDDGEPVGFVSAWFGRRTLERVFRDLPPDVRTRVSLGGAEIFATSDRPSTGTVRTVELGGRRWLVVARGKDVSHASALAVLIGGGVLAIMLGLFTAARVTSERRLRQAHEAERVARERSEVLERNTSLLQRLGASLSAAALPTEVAEAVVPFLFEAFGARLATVGIAHGDDVRTLKVVEGAAPAEWRWRPIAVSASSPTADAMRLGRAVVLREWESIRKAYPGEIEQLLAGVESLHVQPLRGASGAVGIGFDERRALSRSEQRLLDAIAEELGRALDRAALLESEHEARLQAESMERNAERLAAASTAGEVAAATVDEMGSFGADVVIVWGLGDAGRIETLAASGLPEEAAERFRVYPLEGGGLVPDAMSGRRLVAVESEDYDARYPALADDRRRIGAESLVAVPLRTGRGDVIGAIFAAAKRRRWVTSDRRALLLGIAEQTGLALDRASLQADAERLAEADAFLALVGESLERSTTAGGRARRLVDALAEERATFAAVHLVADEGAVEEIASAGSLPEELADPERTLRWIGEVIARGRAAGADDLEPRLYGGSGPSPVVVLPLRARGRSLGALTLRIATGSDSKPVITRPAAHEIAARAALALDNALLYERERDVSHALQIGLLGGALPSFEHVVVASAYRPGSASLEVGGDWYDAFRLDRGVIALVVGDVVGHGLEAAVAMGQLRGAVSALAHSSSPSGLLERLDAFVETVPSAATATLAYVELDPATGVVRYACAGHPPPLVVSPDGDTRFLWEGRSAPLGSILGQQRRQAEDRLADGETLVLYTDGLVERRTASIDVGLERLADVARRSPAGTPRLADEICDALLDSQSQDDVCVLTLYRIPVPSMFSHSFPAATAELADLRERLRAWLERNGVSEDVERGVVLAVSEAAANAVEHGYGCDGTGLVSVTARHDGAGLEITVRDEGEWRESEGSTDRGRGLAIIRAIVDEMWIGRTDGATVMHMRTRARESAAV